jgi:thiol-disulfide isomerase/thioredoxin
VLAQRFFALTLLFTTALPTAFSFAATPAEVKIGERLPDATLRGLNGPPKRLSEFRGKPLIINVWASWCGPCRAEMASLERLAWRDGSDYFNVIGVSTDDYPEHAKATLNAQHATIAHFIDSELRLEHTLGASRVPLTVLIDADGRVVRKIYGARDWDGPDAAALIGRAFGHAPTQAARTGVTSP